MRRTVTNVGGKGSVYFATVEPPSGISIKVSPPIMYFKHVGEKKSFELTVEAKEDRQIGTVKKSMYSFGWLTWNDGIHTVRSPIAVSPV